MQSIQKKIIIVVLFFFVITSYLSFMSFYRVRPALAGVNSFVTAGLNGANSVSTSGGAGVFHTQGENIYALGYSNVRFNTAGQSLQLFTITPPNFSIGCSGISAEWGAFAMLGSELMQVLQSIIQSGEVLVFAFNMVLGVLCKQCQTIMTQIEGIANKLNGLNFNSCQTAEAMGNIAGAELNSMLNKNAASGSANDYHDSQKSLLGNVPTSVDKYITDINTFMNCASNPQNAEALVENNFKSCGEAAAANQFQWGSMMRYAFEQAHIGLIGDTTPGSGGVDDIMAFLRGNLVGDIVGYPSAAISGSEVVKWIPPLQKQGPTIASKQALINTFELLTKGGNNIGYMTIAFPGPSGDINPTSLNAIEQVSYNHCFPGFDFYYKFYLSQVEVNEFGAGTVNQFPATSPVCPSVTISGFGQQQAGDFIQNTQLPVVLITKLAYALKDNALISTAAQAMADGYVFNLFRDMIQSLKENTMAAKNLDHKNKDKIFEIFLKNAESEKKQIAIEYDKSLAKTESQIAIDKYYANLNKVWVSSLAKYGLVGNYLYTAQ